MTQGRSGLLSPTTAVTRSLLRKLVDKGVLTTGDVRELLDEAARSLDLDITPEFAHVTVQEELMPMFFGEEDQARRTSDQRTSL